MFLAVVGVGALVLSAGITAWVGLIVGWWLP